MQQRDRYPSTAWPLALCYAGLVVYASLFPFTGWRSQGLSPLAFVWAPWPRYWTWFDVLSNLVGYVPLGFLLTPVLLRRRCGAWAVLLAGGATFALSLCMEALQTYLPQRVASNVDLALNAAGGLLGAALAWALERLGVIEHGRRWRGRWFTPHSRGALLLLLLWPVGLLFPPPVAFGMGQVLERLWRWLADALPAATWLPPQGPALQPLLPAAELACVTLGALAPCLLGYTVIRHRGRRALFALLALAAGVAVSALSAGLTYGPVNAWVWLERPVMLGLQWAVLLSLAVLLWLPARVCGLLLLLALVAQVVLLNTAPQGAYYAQTLQSWEQGRFIHFNGLAQWVGWLWPFAAMVYLLPLTWSPRTARWPATRERQAPGGEASESA